MKILKKITGFINKVVYFILQKIVLNILLTLIYYILIPIFRPFISQRKKGFIRMDKPEHDIDNLKESS